MQNYKFLITQPEYSKSQNEVKVVILSNLKFNIKNYSFKLKSKKSFCKAVFQRCKVLQNFSGTGSRLNKIHFFKIKSNPIKFRKRKNIYFNYGLRTLPQKANEFFFNFPNYIKYLNILTARLRRRFNLNSCLIKVEAGYNTLNFYIINPNLLQNFLNNEKVNTKSKCIIKITFNFSKSKYFCRKAFLGALIV